MVAALSVKGAEVFLARYFHRADKMNEVRDRDAELIQQVVFEVRDLAKEYWCHSERNPEREGALTGRLMFLGRVCDGLFEQNGDHCRIMQVCINQFDKACTRGNFGSNVRSAEPDRCSDIEQAAYTLAYEVLKRRRKL